MTNPRIAQIEARFEEHEWLSLEDIAYLLTRLRAAENVVDAARSDKYGTEYFEILAEALSALDEVPGE